MTDQRLIANPARTAEIMAQYGINMKKSLGQNFLIEPQILNKMVDQAQVTEKTTVIEIGPGIGALTQFLAMRAKQVYAFEIDKRFVEILGYTLSEYPNVEVIHSDILKVDFASEAYQALREAEDLVVVANLPYYITTPIIMKLIQSDLTFSRLVMMMQKEVAERMTAQVGTKSYNSLTIAIQLYMEARMAFIVPKTVFIPRPNVDSAVLVLTRLDQPRVTVDDPEAFQVFVQSAFQQRRKTLWNNLKFLTQSNQVYSEDDLLQAFTRVMIDPKRRAETLTLEEFAGLHQVIKSQQNDEN